MNAIPQQQRLSAVLSQVATVITLSSSSLGMTRLDKQASARTDAMHNAKNGTGKVSVSRLPGAEPYVKAINDPVNAARDLLHSLTTAFNDQRLLANANMHEWLAGWKVHKAEHTMARDAFLSIAPTLIANADMNKGSYNVETPTLAEIEDAFAMDFAMSQIPDSSTYKGKGMTDAINAEMQRRFEASVSAAYQSATEDAMQRLADPLRKLSEGMTKYEERLKDKANGIDAKGGMFRDTITTNVSDIAKVFRSFNLNGDPFMDALADKVEGLEGIEAEDLRQNETLRKQVTAQADAILADLADLI